MILILFEMEALAFSRMNEVRCGGGVLLQPHMFLTLPAFCAAELIRMIGSSARCAATIYILLSANKKYARSSI